MSKRIGRPPKQQDEVKSARIEIRLTEAEKTAYEAAAHAVGLDLSEWIRTRLQAAAKRSQRGS